MQIAVYRVPSFADVDYVALAKDCGIRNAIFIEGMGSVHAVNTLVVVDSPEAIATLSNNLDFGPESVGEIR